MDTRHILLPLYIQLPKDISTHCHLKITNVLDIMSGSTNSSFTLETPHNKCASIGIVLCFRRWGRYGSKNRRTHPRSCRLYILGLGFLLGLSGFKAPTHCWQYMAASLCIRSLLRNKEIALKSEWFSDTGTWILNYDSFNRNLVILDIKQREWLCSVLMNMTA